MSANARGALQLARETVESWRAPSNEMVWRRCADRDSILLLHGLAGTPRMLHPMRNYLRRELARPALDLALGVGFGDIRDVAIRVHQGLVEQRVRRCDVVGYSMGGLVAAYLMRMPPPAGTSILSIAGSDDTIVPPDATHLEGAGYRNLVVPGLDHWTLATSRRVFRCVKEVLQSERGRLPRPQLAAQPLERVG